MATPTSLDLAELDMLIVPIEGGDQGDLKPCEDYHDDYRDDVAMHDDESNGVLDDLEEIDGDDEEDDIECDLLMNWSLTKRVDT